MPSVLLSGPAGAGKSQEAKRLRDEMPGPAVVIDFQSIYAALTQDRRGPDGKYPLRDDDLLPLTEYVRQAAITGARNAEVGIVATNSDGDPTRRTKLLERLGPGSVERVLDPGKSMVLARLSDPGTGVVSPQCEQAVERWYSRL